jgi:hypothetical protein
MKSRSVINFACIQGGFLAGKLVVNPALLPLMACHKCQIQDKNTEEKKNFQCSILGMICFCLQV